MDTENPKPEVEFVAYPRPHLAATGTADQLEALSDAYFGLAKVFPALVAIVFCQIAFMTMFSDWGIVIPPLIGIGMSWALLFRPCKRYMFGMGWPDKWGPWYALFLAITFAFIVGFFLLALLLQNVATRIFTFGVRKRFLSTFRRRDVQEVVDALRNSPDFTKVQLPQ